MRAITVWRRAQYKTARVRFSQHRPTHSSVASNLPYLSINTFTNRWRPSKQVPRLRPPPTRPRRPWCADPHPLEVARPPRCSGAVPAHPPPPLLRRAGANGRSSEISAATANGWSWPILLARTSPASQAALIGADQLKAAWQLSSDGCGRDGRGRNRLRLCNRPCCANGNVRGPRYKPPERTLFEIRRSATQVITRAGWNARQQNSRAPLSFGLTSSCYRVEQPFIGS